MILVREVRVTGCSRSRRLVHRCALAGMHALRDSGVTIGGAICPLDWLIG